MYGRYQLIKKFFRYYLHASDKKGHGVHSPFVFDFIKHVLNDKTEYDIYPKIETRRDALLQDKSFITVEDLGAGPVVNQNLSRQVSKIAAWSLKPKKFAQLLYRMVKYYRPSQVIELGTSLGITTSYLASASEAPVHTLEGAPAIASIARQTFSSLGFKNIIQHTGNFDQTFPPLLPDLVHPAFVFIDGNHRKEPTLNYFKLLLQYADESTILVFDDIHWSEEMEQAWDIIKSDPAVTLSIDLFFIGIVFFRSEFKVKQHFSVRF